MEEKIELEEFLKEMVQIINKKFEKQENEIKNLTSEIKNFKELNEKNGTEAIGEIKDKISNLENVINSLENKRGVSKSILRVLEGK